MAKDAFYYPLRTAGGIIGIGEPVDLDIYERVSPRLVPGERTMVLLDWGQSNTTNYVNSSYVPTQARNHMLDPITGAMFKTKEPIVGCNGGRYGYPGVITGNCMSRIGDKLILAGVIDRFILLDVAAGGTSSTQWAAGGDCNTRLVTAFNRLKELGLLQAQYVLGNRHQGETDVQNGYSAPTVTANIISETSTLRNLGFPGIMLIDHVAYNGAASVGTAAYNAVRAGQLAACSPAYNTVLGPDSDSLGSTYRQADDLHWNATGADAFSTLLRNSIMSVM